MKSLFILTSFITILGLIITFNAGCSGGGSATTDIIASQKSGVMALSLTIPSTAGGSVSAQPTSPTATSPVAKIVIKILGTTGLYKKEIPVIGTSGKILLDDIPTGLKKLVTVEALNSGGIVIYKTSFTADFISGQTTTSTATLSEVIDFLEYFPLNVGDIWYENDCIKTVTRQTIFNSQAAFEIKKVSYYGKIIGYEYFNLTSEGILRLGEIVFQYYNEIPNIVAEINTPVVVIPRYVQPGDTVNLSVTVTEKPWTPLVVSGIDTSSVNYTIPSTGEGSTVSLKTVSSMGDSSYPQKISISVLSRQSFSLTSGLNFSDTLKFSMVHTGTDTETKIITAAKSVGFVHTVKSDSTSGTTTTQLNGYTIQGVSIGDTSGNPPANSDINAPTISNSVITAVRETPSTVSFNWVSASDDKAYSMDLFYRVYISESPNINTIGEAITNGTAINDWTQNITQCSCTDMPDTKNHYVNVFVKDPSENISNYSMITVTIPGSTIDSTPPTISNTSVNISTTTSSSAIVYWTGATDDTTAASALMYKLFYSTDNSYMSNINAIESTTTAFNDWQASLLSADVTSLQPKTIYYFNVLVKDEAGNKAIYAFKSATTSALTPSIDKTPPTLSSSTITSSANSDISYTINWMAATDDVSTISTLEYKVFLAEETTYINNINTIENNTTVVSDWQTNLLSYQITDLSPETTYYFNVLVRDEAENKTIYAYFTGITNTTPPDISGEYWVDAAASTEGNGSSTTPFQTINEAVTALGSNTGTIKIVTGTYTIDTPIVFTNKITVQGGFTNAGDSSPATSSFSTIYCSEISSGTAITANSDTSIYNISFIGIASINGVFCRGQYLTSNCSFSTFDTCLAIEGTSTISNTYQIDIDQTNFDTATRGLKIYYNSSSSVTMDNLNFSGCETGIDLLNVTSPTLNEAMIYGVTSSSTSKGIIVDNCANTTMQNLNIMAFATGIHCSTINNLKINDIKIDSSNSASTTPQGAVLSNCTDFVIYRGSIANGGTNSIGFDLASSYGTLSNFIFAPTFIPGTGATESKGISASSCSSSLIITNNLFFGCTKGLFLDQSTPIVQCSLFDSCDYGVYESDSSSDTTTVEYNYFRHSTYYDSTYNDLSTLSAFESAIGTTAATGNVFLEYPNEPDAALMTSPETGNFVPGDNSPLIDAGTTNSSYTDTNIHGTTGTTKNDIGPAGGPNNLTDLTTYMVINAY